MSWTTIFKISKLVYQLIYELILKKKKKNSSPNSLLGQEKPEPIGPGTKQVLVTRDPAELFGTQSR